MAETPEQLPADAGSQDLAPYPDQLSDAMYDECPEDIFAGLTQAEMKFVQYFVASGNEQQAAIASGYRKIERGGQGFSEAYSTQGTRENLRLKQECYRLMRRDPVAKALHRWRAYMTQRAAITTDEIIGGLRFFAHQDASAIFVPGTMEPKPISEWPEEHKRAVQKIRIRTQTSHNQKTNTTYTQVVTEIEFPDRIKAYDLLGSHRQLWDKKKEQGEKYILQIVRNDAVAPPALPPSADAEVMERLETGAFQIARPRQTPPAAPPSHTGV